MTPHWTTVLSAGKSGKDGSKQLGTVVNNKLTEAQWTDRGTVGKEMV